MIWFWWVKHMKDIGSTIQRLREAKGYTQEQLAEKLFVSRQTVSNYERNKSQPSLEMLSRIAEVFDTDVASLLSVPKDKKAERRILFVQGFFCLFLLAACLFLSPIAAARKREYWDTRLLYWLSILLNPLLWAAVGYFLLSVIVTAARIHWKKKTWHNVVFAVVIAVAALYLIAMSPFLLSYKIPGAWSRFLYWILGAAPGHHFPQAYLVLAFAFGATLRICRPGVGSSAIET